MNKKATASLAIGMFMLMNINTPLAFAADSAEEQLGVQIEKNVTLTMQEAKASNSKEKKDINSATYKVDLKFIKEFEKNEKLVLHLNGKGSGFGLNKEISALDYTNSSDGSTANDPAADIAKITELYYQRSFLNNKITANFGKLNLGGYFANNNETSQFLTGSFTTDKLIDAPTKSLALILNAATINQLDIAYAYFTPDPDIDFDRNGFNIIHGFNIIQGTYKSPKNGNYRLYGWLNNNKEYSSYKNNNSKESGTYGLGISADQKINEAVAVFARVGYKNHCVAKTDESNLSFLLWNIGAQIKGLKWSRINDVIGFAVGQMYYRDTETYKNNSETQIELYYNFAVNDYISIAPVIQYFRNQDKKLSTLVNGIRISITF
ncbi:MAG: carbohydrate porin [Endomicrobium sp.]|jgi:carbohydrate-selective porin OprB|nr:carbohydrate porin [Endomicrobium sp.]